VQTSETMIDLASIRLMLNRMARRSSCSQRCGKGGVALRRRRVTLVCVDIKPAVVTNPGQLPWAPTLIPGRRLPEAVEAAD